VAIFQLSIKDTFKQASIKNAKLSLESNHLTIWSMTLACGLFKRFLSLSFSISFFSENKAMNSMKLTRLNIIQLDGTGPLMHRLDDLTTDWTIDCDDVEIKTDRLYVVMPIATLNLSTDSTPTEIIAAIYDRFVAILENN
jgi:hypothetical protein